MMQDRKLLTINESETIESARREAEKMAAEQKKAEEAYAQFAGPGKGREEYPNKVRFVTYTLKYPTCAWVELLGLDTSPVQQP